MQHTTATRQADSQREPLADSVRDPLIPAPARQLGHGHGPHGQYARVVERCTVIEGATSFRALCARVLSDQTRYLILDLDRTTHRDRNLGELLGWEIAGYRVHGAAALETLSPNLGRLFWNGREPWKFVRYWSEGIRTWTFPGLSYLLWGKLSAHVPLLERWAYRKFGPEPMQAVQRVPQTALLHKLSTLPESTLRMLSRRVWNRLAPDQVITREDLCWVRERCPGIRIIITSASPKPMLEVAAEELGVDDIEYSSSAPHGDSFSAPYWVDRRFALGPLEHIATPREVHINSGHNKVERLLERYPDLADASVESVGISDTGYGEDHGWAQYLSVVVDINSSAPFPPVVAFDAPLREVWSAKLHTQRERDTASTDTSAHDHVWTRTQLEQLLSEELAALNGLARAFEASTEQQKHRLDGVRGQLRQAFAAITRAVNTYNQASAEERATALVALRRALRQQAQSQRALARAQAPLSALRMRIARVLRSSRARLTVRSNEQTQSAAQLSTAAR